MGLRPATSSQANQRCDTVAVGWAMDRFNPHKVIGTFYLLAGVFAYAVGGITEGKHAAEKIAAGASLVQLYSGFIYKGPALIRESVRNSSYQTRFTE